MATLSDGERAEFLKLKAELLTDVEVDCDEQGVVSVWKSTLARFIELAGREKGDGT